MEITTTGTSLFDKNALSLITRRGISLFLHILNQIRRLAFQKLAQSLKILPRHALLVSELLERRLAQQALCANPVGVIALHLQCGKDIHLVLQRHNDFLLLTGLQHADLFHCPYYSPLVARNQVQICTEVGTNFRAFCQLYCTRFRAILKTVQGNKSKRQRAQGKSGTG